MPKKQQWVCCIALLWLLTGVAKAQLSEQTPIYNPAPQIALVTFGPGPEIWARFGHNAIRVTWPQNNLIQVSANNDALYNFGYFDFTEPGFYWNYATGNMQYYAVPEDPVRAFDYYQNQDRSIREQQLDLTPQQALQIANELQRLIQPDQRRYPYDYFFNNCSTRVRDILDQALNGALQQQYQTQAAAHNLRWDALRMVNDVLLLYLGLHIGLGRVVDQPISQWDAAFLPNSLANQTNTLQQPVVVNDQIIYRGQPEPTHFQARFLSMAILGLITVLIILLPTFSKTRWLALVGARLWLLLSGLAGLLLLFLWLASDHQAAWRNENLLLLLPTNIMLIRMRYSQLEKAIAWLIPVSILAALLLKLIPHSQFNMDLWLWFIPTQLAVFYCWRRHCNR